MDAFKSKFEEIHGESVRFALRDEDPPKKTKIGYKVFFVKDGKLYPPMVANPGGADTPVGVWLNADIGVQAPDSKTGRKQVKAGGKGTQGGSGSLSFRPGWHLGEIPLATQFDRVNPETGEKELFPENFVWAECEIAADVDYQEEAMSYGYTENGKFRHSYAGLPRVPENGYYKYRTNPNPDTVPWLITGAMKVTHFLSDDEVNEILAQHGIAPKQRVGGNKTLADLGLEEVEENLRKAGPESERFDEKKSDIRFSPREIEKNAFEKNKYYDRQLDKWNDLEDGTRVKVGDLNTGSALNRVGFPAAGMWFDVGKIKKAMNKHDDHLTVTILKQIPQLLSNPIAITEYKGPDGDIHNTATVYGLIMPDGKTPIAVGVMMEKYRDGGMIINKIRTVHARSNAVITDDNVLYLNEDKKRTREWFQVCGISVPLEGSKFGLIRTITYVDSKSQPPSVKKSDRETDVPDARTLLSNALVSAAQNDVERQRLSDYQAKIETMNAAQARLEELNAEIHSMTFTKGKRDTARLRALQDEQVQLRNRINNYDKQLLRLEASTPLQRVVEEEKRKAVRKVREKTAEKLEQLADRRESRDLREKIKRIRDDFQKRLFQGNERTHIPQALVNGVIDICEAIDPTTNTTLMVRRTDANGRILYSEKTHRPLYRKAEKGEFTEAEIEAGLKDGSLRMFGAPQQERYRSGLEALSSLRSAYEDLKNSNDTDLSTEFKAEFAERIGDLAAAIGMTPLRDMNRLQLEDVYNVLSDLRHMVMNAKKQIGTARAIANYEVVQNIIANMRDVKSRKLTTGKVGSFFRDWMTNPVRAVRELTGFDENAELTRLIMDFVEGQRKGDIFSMNAHKKFEALQTGKNRKLFRNAVEKPFNFGLKDVDGKPLKISKMQAMQILLTYERETLNANRRHLSTNIYDL